MELGTLTKRRKVSPHPLLHPATKARLQLTSCGREHHGTLTLDNLHMPVHPTHTVHMHQQNFKLSLHTDPQGSLQHLRRRLCLIS